MVQICLRAGVPSTNVVYNEPVLSLEWCLQLYLQELPVVPPWPSLSLLLMAC